MRRARAALTARSTVLALLVVLAGALGAAAVLPQRAGPRDAAGAAPASWLGRAAHALGLDHVLSTWWFAAVALLLVASLALSTLEQARLALARMRHPPSGAAEGHGVRSSLSVESIAALLSSAGYRRMGEGPGAVRLGRHRAGYWGSFLLHAGLTVTLLFAFAYVLTENRARVHVASGRTIELLPTMLTQRIGLLAGRLPLPAQVNLYRVEPTFGANDQLVDLASQLVFTDGEGTARELRVAVNDHQDYQGDLVYQLVEFGNVFDVEVADGTGAVRPLALELPYPEKRGAASYTTLRLGDGWTLKAKYHASADRTELLLKDPELVLRLYRGEQLLEERALRAGQAGRLGPWSVRLARVGWWTDILFEGSAGTTGVFTGFALLLLGAVLWFFAVPREVVVRATPDGCRIGWRAERFSELYLDERDGILARCTGDAPP